MGVGKVTESDGMGEGHGNDSVKGVRGDELEQRRAEEMVLREKQKRRETESQSDSMPRPANSPSPNSCC